MESCNLCCEIDSDPHTDRDCCCLNKMYQSTFMAGLRTLTHAQKPAPEIGAIGLNTTPDFGASFSCRCTISSWWSGVVVSTLALINEVNLRRTRLVLRWVTVSGSIPGAGHLFQYVTNQPPKANSAFQGSVNEYQFRLGRKRQVWFVSG